MFAMYPQRKTFWHNISLPLLSVMIVNILCSGCGDGSHADSLLHGGIKDSQMGIYLGKEMQKDDVSMEEKLDMMIETLQGENHEMQKDASLPEDLEGSEDGESSEEVSGFLYYPLFLCLAAEGDDVNSWSECVEWLKIPDDFVGHAKSAKEMQKRLMFAVMALDRRHLGLAGFEALKDSMIARDRLNKDLVGSKNYVVQGSVVLTLQRGIFEYINRTDLNKIQDAHVGPAVTKTSLRGSKTIADITRINRQPKAWQKTLNSMFSFTKSIKFRDGLYDLGNSKIIRVIGMALVAFGVGKYIHSKVKLGGINKEMVFVNMNEDVSVASAIDALFGGGDEVLEVEEVTAILESFEAGIFSLSLFETP